MPITKNHLIAATGATAGYHVVKSVAVDLLLGTMTVTVLNFISQAAYDSGALPIWSMPVSIPLPTIGAGLQTKLETWLLLDPATPLT